MAMLVQYLSAKVGIATGMNLPELCRAHLPRRATWGLWVQAEIIAIATDLAEFVGAAIALNLLFGVPPFAAGLITAVVAFGILALQQRGYRRFELAIAGFLAIVCLGFLYDLSQVSVDTPALLGGFVPAFDGTDSVMIAVGILGATVMPHVVYLHSALVQGRVPPRDDGERRSLLRFQRVDVVIAMGLAGVINLTMLVVAASLFHETGNTGIDSIEGAHAGFERLIGGGAALAFAVALLASGLSSSSVGTYAGQVVMQGFIDRRIPLFLRRLVTMAPALVVLAIGVDATDALVASQVVLVVRDPVRARADDPAHATRGRDGRARQPARDDDRGLDRRDADHPAQRVPARADVLRLSWPSGTSSRPSGSAAGWTGGRRPHGGDHGRRGDRRGRDLRGRRRRGDRLRAAVPARARATCWTHVARERVVGVLLVRLGGHAAGVFRGTRLVDSKVGAKPVHGRHRAGGSSSGRFARRRAGQARVALEAAADVAARVLRVPAEAGELDAVVLGGDRTALGTVLEDPRLAAVRAVAVERVLAVPDPRLRVLEATPDAFRATVVRVR